MWGKKAPVHFLIALLLFYLVSSCGYRKTEKDKYPDMPVFPNMEGGSVKMDTIPFRYISLSEIVYNDKYYFVPYYTDYNHSGMAVVDGVLNLISNWSYDNSNFTYLTDTLGSVIAIDRINKTASKYQAPYIEATDIPFLKMDKLRERLGEKYNSFLEEAKRADSSYVNTDNILDSIYMAHLLEKHKGYTPYLLTGGSYDYPPCIIFVDKKEPEKQLLAEIPPYSIEPEEWNIGTYPLLKKRVIDLPDTENPSLVNFDDAVLENRFGGSGNHFVADISFRQSGYQYYKLTENGKEHLFKIYHTNLNFSVLQEIKNPFNNQVLFINNENNNLYLIRKN